MNESANDKRTRVRKKTKALAGALADRANASSTGLVLVLQPELSAECLLSRSALYHALGSLSGLGAVKLHSRKHALRNSNWGLSEDILEAIQDPSQAGLMIIEVLDLDLLVSVATSPAFGEQ